MKGKFAFGKREKLKSRALIRQVFEQGRAIHNPPLRLVFIPTNSSSNVLAGVTVSSKTFRRSVDRNRVKRLLREAYRLNKEELISHLNLRSVKLAFFIIYTGRELPPLSILVPKMQVILAKLIEATSEAVPENT